MVNGWAGLSLVCHSTSLQAAQMSCAGTPGCTGISGTESPGVGGSVVFPFTSQTGSGTVAVQPCARIDGTFFAGLLPVIVPAIVAIVCAKFIQRQFFNHA